VRLSKDKERIERALAATAKIVEAHPGNLEAWFARAELFWLQGTNNQAIGELSEVVRQHPENAEVYIRRAQAYNDAKDFSKAMADADYAIRLDPCNGHGYLQRAFAFALQHKYQLAVEAYLEAINVDPELAEPFNGLAWLLATCPDPSVRNGTKAAEYINRALQLAPDRWDIWGTRAAVFAENSDFENAVSWEERCVQRNDLSEEQRRRASERLALYRAGKPYREEPK
jgi:tetratricopeptide (TPR) repeat protein